MIVFNRSIKPVVRLGISLIMVLMLVGCGEEEKTATEKNKRDTSAKGNVSSIVSTDKKSTQKKPGVTGSSTADSGNELKQQYSDTQFKILDFSEREYQGASSLGLVLSVPLDSRSDFQKFLILERKDGERVDGAWILSNNGKELFFKNIDPESDYLLTVYANLTAFNDKTLGERFKKNIKTKAIEASVSFAHDGGILPLTHSKGLPVYSINVKQVDVEFHRIKSDQLLPFLQQWRGGTESYYRLDQYAEKADFVYSSRFDLPIEKNKRERVLLPIDTIKALEPSGIYLAVMKVAGQYDYRQAVTYFIRSDIGVHVRRYPGKLHAYTRSLITGDPLDNISIRLLDNKNKELAVKHSDKNGRVEFDNSLSRAHLLLAQNGQQMSLVRLNSPALDLSEFNVGFQTQYQNEAFFYTPRDLYRPGETVDISLLLRNFDGRSVPNIPLKAIIKRPDGQEVKRFTWHSAKMGYYHHRYQLTNSARTGNWTIEIHLPGEKKSKKNSTRHWSFKVEDFLPERMKLTLGSSTQNQFITTGSALNIPVEGVYLYGAPASGNRLETIVKSYINQSALENLPGYLFGLAEEKNALLDFKLDETRLDEQGKTELHIPPRWQSVQSPVAIRIQSSLFETGGRAVKRQANYRIWPAKTLIGIRPHWIKSQDDSSEEDNEPEANTLLGFDVVNADKNGVLHRADNLIVTLIKKRRDYYWKYNNSDEWEMDYSEKQYPVYHQNLTIEAGQKSTINVPVEWGYYRLEIQNPDTKKTTSVEFNAGGAWYYNNQNNRITRPDKVNLTLDKLSYVSGDTAKLTIKSPFTGQGMLLIENNEQLLWYKNINLSNSNELKLDVPVQSGWNRHDIYISTVLFNHPEQLIKSSGQNKTKDEKQMIKRAVGLIHLPLDRSSRKLDISIHSAEKTKPFSQLPVTIKLLNFQKKSQQNSQQENNIKSDHNTNKPVMVTLAAVDVGVLNVSNFKTPDAFSWFFAQRRYDVDSLDLYGHIMDGRKGITGQQRFGGDMDLTAAGNLQKAKVKIVSLFHQPVTFNEQGEAEIVLDIPDFNGQLRLMALAFDESRYGHSENHVTIAAPVVTQLSMPLFLAANDKSTLTLDVHNLSEKQQSIDIEMSGDGVIEIQEPRRQVHLEHNEKSSLNFMIKSHDEFALADINLHLVKSKQNKSDQNKNKEQPQSESENADDDIELHRQWQLAVRPAWPAVQRNQQKIISDDTPVKLSVKTDDMLPDTVAAKLLVSNQPPINLAGHMEHLLKYPYGCLEQTTSSSFPWLYADSDNMNKLGLENIKLKNKPIDFSQRKTQLARGVQRLSAKQLSNGGFGLWSNQSSEELWLSVYATQYLLQAKEQNVDVPSSVLKPAVKRLQQYLRSTRPGYNYRYSQYPEHFTIAYKAYAAYVLSSLKKAPLGTMRTLFDYHVKDARSGLPLMHLGIALTQQGDLKRGKKAIEQALNAKRDADDYLGDYGSTLRDIALMLDALVRFDSRHPGVTDLLYQLQEELGKRQWLSTQERNALFMVGVALKSTDQKQWQALLETALGQEKIIQEGDFQYYPDATQVAEGISLKSLGQERLYASLDINGYTRVPPEANFEYFNITRTYYNAKGEMIVPDQVAVGELIIVELSLQSKNRIQDALVVDLVPAGFEIENQNLAHSMKLEDYRIGQDAIIDKMSTKEIKYQQWRDDRYVAAIDLHSYGTQRLYYLLRAVTPGVYQVPPSYAEDMYRPYIRAIGETPEPQTIVNRAQ